jgi:uncharacterized surface protein with fasciclin (FAS1) repeats
MRLSRAAGAVVACAALMALTACGGDTTSSANQPTTMPSAPATTDQFGSACSQVPKDGEGSFQGMARDPVAAAASNNPALSTLVSAVKQAGLVDTLNTAKDITVFAPTNNAFAKIPPADLENVLADKDTLTEILTYHVVGKRLSPSDLASGNFQTLQMGMVATSGLGNEYKVNDARVVCGNVQTANATVYLIDTVLMPK